MEGIEGTSGLADPPPSEPVVDGAHVPSIAAAEPLLLRAGMTSLVDPSAPASDNDEADLASGRFEREAAAGEVLINDLALASAATPSDAPADAATLLSGDAGGTLAGNRVAASGGQEYGGPGERPVTPPAVDHIPPRASTLTLARCNRDASRR